VDSSVKLSTSGGAMDISFERLLDSQEAAKLLNIHPKTIVQMARRGEIPAMRIGKFWRFRASALDKWVRSAVDSSTTRTYRETLEDQV
jgi:excisionase family DNA binding protein